MNNDLNLVHEQALLDAAAGLGHRRDLGFDQVVTLGHSGGGALYTSHHEQSGSAPEQRIATTPAGRPSGRPEAELPRPDGAVSLARPPRAGAAAPLAPPAG